MVVRGVSGLRPAVALLGVGSPLTMYWTGLAKRAVWATLAIYADERNLCKRRYYRRGKWLLPLSQNGMAAGLLGS